MLNMVKVCSDSEFEVRKELTGYLSKNFGLKPNEQFMWVTSRVLNGENGFTVGKPFYQYVNQYLLYEAENGRHFIDDAELMLLSEARWLMDGVGTIVGKDCMDVVRRYYIDRKGISDIVAEGNHTFSAVKKMFGEYHRKFDETVCLRYAGYRDVEGTSVLSLRIGWKQKSVLWNAGIKTVEDLNTCFYTGSTDIEKLLKPHQLSVLSDALKNLESA